MAPAKGAKKLRMSYEIRGGSDAESRRAATIVIEARDGEEWASYSERAYDQFKAHGRGAELYRVDDAGTACAKSVLIARMTGAGSGRKEPGAGFQLRDLTKRVRRDEGKQ